MRRLPLRMPIRILRMTLPSRGRSRLSRRGAGPVAEVAGRTVDAPPLHVQPRSGCHGAIGLSMGTGPPLLGDRREHRATGEALAYAPSRGSHAMSSKPRGK
jgi:hypothetical protein